MPKLRLLIVLGVIGIVLITTFGLKNATSTKPTNPDVRAEVGYTAPDFTLQDLNGKTVKLSDFRGKAVYINFWASWCPPCKEEMPELQKFYSKNKDNFVMLAINITYNDKLNDVKKVLKENGITYPVLLDKDQNNGAATAYAITGIPEHFFIDKNGVLRAHDIGPLTQQALQQYLSKVM